MTIHPPVPPRPALLRLLCALTLTVSALVLSHPPAAAAAAFTVTKTSDSKDDVCNRDCSLREAIIAAHRNPGVDTITLPAGLYRVTLSDLDITSSLHIIGAGAAATIIESNGQDRVVEVRPDTTVTIRNVTIRNGQVSAANGAGILNNGTLTLSESVVSGNRSQDGRGGGISNAGALTLTHSTVSGNAAHSGGGIENTAAGTLTVSESIVSDNTAAVGAGIFTQGTAQLAQSVVRSNSGQVWAGGIYNSGDLSLSNSTVSDNRLPDLNSDGGGLMNYSGTMTLTDSRVSANQATSGGGIRNVSGTVTLTNSQVSANQATNGGGIFTTGKFTFFNSTVSENRATLGGGIFNDDQLLTLSNSTISGNRGTAGGGLFIGRGATQMVNSTLSGNAAADDGGAIFFGIGWEYPRGSMSLRNVTITDNTADANRDGVGTGGGINNPPAASDDSPDGFIGFTATIIAGNRAAGAASDCAGELSSGGYNLIGTASGCTIRDDATGNVLGINPQLGPLQNNGGPTLTHLPLLGSPAIDASSPAAPGSGGSACPTTDQRGQTRPRDGNGDGVARCDIGAVER
jgi:CSLREA domain-containing protein